MKPIPVGTLVDYHGSHKHGRYVITAHHCPHDLFPRNEWDEVAQYYPDGVAYEIWPEGTEIKFGLRHLSVYRVRRSSLTVCSEAATPVVNCTREGFEPMEPFISGVTSRWRKTERVIGPLCEAADWEANCDHGIPGEESCWTILEEGGFI